MFKKITTTIAILLGMLVLSFFLAPTKAENIAVASDAVVSAAPLKLSVAQADERIFAPPLEHSCCIGGAYTANTSD